LTAVFVPIAAESLDLIVSSILCGEQKYKKMLKFYERHEVTAW
jgi:hypothetical protein